MHEKKKDLDCGGAFRHVTHQVAGSTIRRFPGRRLKSLRFHGIAAFPPAEIDRSDPYPAGVLTGGLTKAPLDTLGGMKYTPS
jgi:hypothetical protein